MFTILVTGSSGLIGSQTCRFFGQQGYRVVGIDNDMRSYFFGKEATTTQTLKELRDHPSIDYTHYDIDIRNREKLNCVFEKYSFDVVIHTAAQPSHDWAAKEPLTDYSINSTATLYLLECLRKYCPEATFIFTSTNKVYGDTPNGLPLEEKETRWEINNNHRFKKGIDETMSIDNSTHSIFGVSKLSADLMVQEYGRYFNLNTTCFRGGCLTGKAHAGAELHGFLSHLIKAAKENIPYSDLVKAFWEVHRNPKQGEVYNIGGSRHSCISMLEAINFIGDYLNKKIDFSVGKENRIGDHIWYISDVSKFKKHYPEWSYTYNIEDILKEMLEDQ